MKIGPFTLDNALALAPMAGVTDLPFRKLCRELGAGYVVSEMVHSDPRLRHTRKSRLRSNHQGEAEPIDESFRDLGMAFKCHSHCENREWNLFLLKKFEYSPNTCPRIPTTTCSI